MVRERTGHRSSYAEAKKMKSLTLHTHDCPRASLRDRSSSCSINNEACHNKSSVYFASYCLYGVNQVYSECINSFTSKHS